MLNAVRDAVTHHYLIHGYGNSINVQARLAQRGHVYHAEWDPGPPSWRFYYDTYLSHTELQQVLEDLIARFDVKFAESK